MMEAVRSDQILMYFEGAPTCVLMTAYEGNEGPSDAPVFLA